MYLAHISDARVQTVKEHLLGTADMCREFAAVFGAEEQGELAGPGPASGGRTAFSCVGRGQTIASYDSILSAYRVCGGDGNS